MGDKEEIVEQWLQLKSAAREWETQRNDVGYFFDLVHFIRFTFTSLSLLSCIHIASVTESICFSYRFLFVPLVPFPSSFSISLF
jgi:hypothetical protein